MPQAVTHFLIPAILTALFRGYYLSKKSKRTFPLHYILIAGLAGLLPDLDIAIFYILSFSGYTIETLHRTFTHNIFFPLGFLLIGFIVIGTRNKELGKHKLKLSTIFFIIAFGITTHLILDATLAGTIQPFYPINTTTLSLNLLDNLPQQFQDTIIPVIDAVLLVFWMIYIEVKHKISDYI